MDSVATDVQRLADALRHAEEAREPIPPLTETDPALEVEDAYAIQTANVECRLGAGGVIVGRKIGITSKPMQEMLGVSEPDYGALLADMGVDDGGDVSLGTLIQPKIEAEIAFLMGEDLTGPGITATRAMPAVAGVLPALEIIDSRIADWRIGLVDTVADNASAARFAVGTKLTPLPGLDLRLEGMALYRDGTPVETAAGAAVLGNPLHAVAWLANKLAEFGTRLKAGDVVLAGAMHRALPVAGGEVYRADFASLGSVTVSFAD